MAEWKIARRRDRCSRCEAAFGEDAKHVSTLRFQGDALVREDLCPACFDGREPGQDIFFWYTRERNERRGLALDLPTLEQLFLRLEGNAEPRIEELRYVIALLLMRKRRLKLVRVVRDPRETMLLRRPRRDEGWRVPVCDFDPARIDALKSDLMAIFDGTPEDVGTGGEAQGSPPAATAGCAEGGAGDLG
jgi:hypothetical protein